ncbi:uncharacterized protein LOC113521761 isoform X2 [Galleria mellonella]|uniref:ascorbate ferrireductase (transmembrane) n=1 Tax=Galleria mellonella TaxID=7137 RepID=A0ABM3MG12_GALME|nr:uncharacterized protein LOC113521761 isoform X2 [Galleria mellonella]
MSTFTPYSRRKQSKKNDEVRNDYQANPGEVRGDYVLKIVRSVTNLTAHILIGATVGICVWFGFRNGLPLSATSIHIVLCVIGYQLLMAEAILCLSPDNSWTASYRVIDKKRAHWILQIVGSALAITGSFIKFANKTSHWNSLHGKFALVALVFTCMSLVNGLSSLYSHELRSVIPGNISKISHICFGSIAFAAASTSLCCGFNKHSFTSWATSPLAYTATAFTTIFTFIVIVSPLINFVKKIRR